MVSVDSLEPVKRCGNGAMRLSVAAAGARDGHVVSHELYLIGAVVSAVVGELDFKSPYGFEVDFKCHLARARPYSPAMSVRRHTTAIRAPLPYSHNFR